jgi:hypothetical protein
MKRIQRKRTKGWKMPDNAESVDSGALWLDDEGSSNRVGFEAENVPCSTKGCR